ncbi:enoyl-CoA hydratase/isomerase family protein [Niveispirillum sp.]|uniref:enoyl-CoA hydratase/isomerase family protein n=1 Tax=Niveispirillum sp. TaxID=1917217 RepID=UPI001B727560|nr:enoyl-CoA hydratase/isomerase family protein [Niveispirillum sp.]MBP7334352.1 enoyl-CoA hydratase/isomerase family protein [Niveispirillum sp.]
MDSLLIDDPRPGVRRLRLNRPAARNAIDADLRAALRAAVTAAQVDPSVRALLIGGEGGVFCAGGDLASLEGIAHDAALARMRDGHALVEQLWHFPKPVVAAIERYAIGAGAGLALLADRVVMGDDALLGFPFLKLGLVPDWGLMETLPLRAGLPQATRLFLDAGNLKATDALAAGVADAVAPAGTVMEAGLDMAGRLAALPPAAFARLKSCLRPAGLDLDAEAHAQADCLTGPEFREGYAALKEKRAARF